MTDFSPTSDEPTPTAPTRPNWRFSGRRGTPVHKREQAPTTLPPELQKTLTQLARERSGEQSSPQRAASNASSPAAATDRPLQITNPKWSASPLAQPPVSAAPLPVERRNRSEVKAEVVTPTPATALPATEEISPERAVEAAAELDLTPIMPEATQIIAAAGETEAISEPSAVTESEVTATAEPEAVVESAADVVVAPATPKPTLTAAQQKRLAKARARKQKRAKKQRGGRKLLGAPKQEDSSELNKVEAPVASDVVDIAQPITPPPVETTTASQEAAISTEAEHVVQVMVDEPAEPPIDLSPSAGFDVARDAVEALDIARETVEAMTEPEPTVAETTDVAAIDHSSVWDVPNPTPTATGPSMKTTRLIDDPWACDDGTQRGVPRSIQQLSEPLALPSSFSRAREINANASGSRIPRVSDGAHRDRLAQRRNELTQTLDELAQVVATHSLDTAEHISS